MGAVSAFIRGAGLASVAVILVGCALQRDLADVPAPALKPGTVAPAFTGTTVDGKPIALRDYAGKPVVLNFWGSWCAPCRTEQPGLEALWREFRAQGVQFLGVDIRDSAAGARAYLEEFGVTYPSVFDRPAELAARYEVAFPPSTVLIDAGGEIVHRAAGALSEKSLRRLIETRLLEKPKR